MTAFTRTIVAFVTVTTGIVLVSSTASADRRSDCAEARSFLRSEGARRTCSSRYHTARSLFCSSATSQRLLLSMAHACKARAAATPASSGGATKEPAESKDPKEPKAGGKASITAFQMDGTTVIEVVPCAVGVVGPEYPKCLGAVKAKLKADHLCKPGTKGPAKFKFRMGEIPQILTDHVDC